jgi:hypothetical protein
VDEAEQAIVDRVRTDAPAWFPGTPRDPAVHLRPLGTRRRSRLYAVSLGDLSAAPQLVAKVRNEHTAVAGGTGAPRRPVLAPTVVDEAELTACEYSALQHLETVFAGDDPRFGAVRALAHLPGHHAIIMGLVPGVPMRELVIRWSRLHLGRQRSHLAPEPVFRAAGAWLRAFHQATPTADHPVRQGTGADVVTQFEALEDFLGSRLGRRFGRLAGAGSALAAEVLPPGDLPLAVGHGDFAPRNVMVEPRTGRIVVLDPLARWAVPQQEDLCRFLVGLQLNGLQVHTRGAAYAAGTLARWQREVVTGYYGDAVPLGSLLCYQLLLLLDKWSAQVEPARNGGVVTSVRRTARQAATGYLRTQAERLLDLARSADG